MKEYIINISFTYTFQMHVYSVVIDTMFVDTIEIHKIYLNLY